MIQEREQAAKEQEQREVEIARGNPLLNPQDFNIKRRWDDDVIFKNQARGTENKGDKEFVNVSHLTSAPLSSLVNYLPCKNSALANWFLILGFAAI